jgi:hypothetical protein
MPELTRSRIPIILVRTRVIHTAVFLLDLIGTIRSGSGSRR